MKESTIIGSLPSPSYYLVLYQLMPAGECHMV